MLPAALTAERVRLPDGTSATRYPWNGEEVLVRDDALTIIRVIEVLTDEGKSDDQRRDEFLALFFVDWADAWCACDYDAAEFVRMRDAAVWDMCGLDLTGDRPHETPLWDWRRTRRAYAPASARPTASSGTRCAVASALPSSWHSWAAARRTRRSRGHPLPQPGDQAEANQIQQAGGRGLERRPQGVRTRQRPQLTRL